MKPAPTIQAIDLFCGSGGLSAGLMNAGMEVIDAYDNWPAAVKTYKRNIGSHVRLFDLRDIAAAAKAISNLNPDLIAGGPPCQDFSTAGKRAEGRQASMTVAFGLVIAKCAPRFVLMENVPQARFSQSYQYTRGMLEMLGYQFRECVLDASRCGTPQARKRFFAFGWLEGDERIGEKFMASIQRRLATRRLTVKEYMGADIDVEFYYRHPRNYSRRAIFTVHEPSPTIRGVNRPVPPNYKGNYLDSAPPSSARTLTSWERSRIQTFPKDWDWRARDRNAEAELQIGNAVPVNLASFVAEGVLHAI